MKSFEEHILVISGCDTIEKAYNAVSLNTLRNWNREAADRYARQCCEDVLNLAAENATIKTESKQDDWGFWEQRTVDKESITNTEIILP